MGEGPGNLTFFFRRVADNLGTVQQDSAHGPLSSVIKFMENEVSSQHVIHGTVMSWILDTIAYSRSYQHAATEKLENQNELR